MFGGVGGFRLGLERANLPTPSREESRRIEKGMSDDKSLCLPRQQFRCVGYAEIDKYAVQAYNANFGETHEPTDVTKIDWSKQPDFDLLCAGFPCQAFSIAGKRRGFEDTRGTLFFEVARCAREKQPHYLLLENVKGLLSHDKGNSFATILATLDGLGYDAEWQVLNSKDFGVPQNRERVFIFAWKKGEETGRVFPIFPRGERVVLADVLEPVVDEKYYLSEQATKQLTGTMHRQDGSYAIDAHYSKGTRNLDKKQRQLVAIHLKTNTKQGYDEATEGDGVRLQFGNSKTARGRVIKQTAQALQLGAGGVISHSRIRRLTPTETERLQGFPDGWTKMLLNTRRYKAMGNAVTVNVIKAIAEKVRAAK